jgi:hypothetical protein
MPGAYAMRNIWSEAEAPNLPKRFTKRYNEGRYDKESKEDSNQPPWPVWANTLPTIYAASVLAGDFTVIHFGSLSAADHG